MNPVLLQKQLRENASDLNEFYKELQSWGDDMKQKEESLKKTSESNTKTLTKTSEFKKRKTVPNEKKIATKVGAKPKSKIGFTDYSAWEKFDVDAECEKVDYNENEESDLTDECDETVRDQAYLEKEKGNKFVKNKHWEQAIESYTRAIDLYAFDPIFYANRALCFLKKQNFTKAEADCTMSLKLDKTYVKAYQRRAAAMEAQNKLEEAQADLLKVLEFEPANKESKTALDSVRKKLQNAPKVVETTQRPVSKFTASRNQKKIISQISNSLNNNNNKKIVDLVKPEPHWPSGNDNIILVNAVNKPIHLRSKKSLKRIDIQEICEIKETTEETVKSLPHPNNYQATLRTDDLKIIERKIEDNKIKEGVVAMSVPRNSVQFYTQWRHLNTIEKQYEYLKLIKPEELKNIFKESLDSDVFSKILEVLAKCFVKDKSKNIFTFLSSLTEIKRFSAFTMFMSNDDKKYLWTLFDYVKEYEDKPKAEIDILIKKYEL